MSRQHQRWSNGASSQQMHRHEQKPRSSHQLMACVPLRSVHSVCMIMTHVAMQSSWHTRSPQVVVQTRPQTILNTFRIVYWILSPFWGGGSSCNAASSCEQPPALSESFCASSGTHATDSTSATFCHGKRECWWHAQVPGSSSCWLGCMVDILIHAGKNHFCFFEFPALYACFSLPVQLSMVQRSRLWRILGCKEMCNMFWLRFECASCRASCNSARFLQKPKRGYYWRPWFRLIKKKNQCDTPDCRWRGTWYPGGPLHTWCMLKIPLFAEVYV